MESPSLFLSFPLNRFSSYFFAIISVLALSSHPLFAETKSRVLCIPYPSGDMYLESGITATVGAGMHKARGKFFGTEHLWELKNKMFQWQGEGSFYYTPNISGGLSATIVAGEPTQNTTQVENRYTAFVRYHFHNSRMALYLGPFLGLFNLEFSENTLTDSVESKISKKGRKIHDMQTAVLDYGLAVGSGWNFSRFAGVTLGAKVEQVWNGGLDDSMAETRFQISSGISVDITSIFPGRVIRQKVSFFIQEFNIPTLWIRNIQEEYLKKFL